MRAAKINQLGRQVASEGRQRAEERRGRTEAERRLRAEKQVSKYDTDLFRRVPSAHAEVLWVVLGLTGRRQFRSTQDQETLASKSSLFLVEH